MTTLSSHAIATAIFLEGQTIGDGIFTMLETLQAQDPVFHLPEADIWIATSNAAVREILKSPAAQVGFAARNDRTQPGWRDHHARANMTEWMGHLEGAEHRKMRGPVNAFFMPSMAQASETILRAAIRDVVVAFKAKGGGDFLVDVGYAITAKVTDHLLGLDGTAHPDFRHAIERIMKTFDFHLTDEEWRLADVEATKLRAFWVARLRERIANPVGDDIMAQLIRSGQFDEHHLILIAENILAAASDTTANTITNALHLLLRHPDQLALARRDAQARANIPEEVMRLVSAAPSSGRLTVNEMNFANLTIPPGEVVITILAAANRDPAIFDDPHRLDLTRARSSRTVGFGVGSHICLGQWFAKSVIYNLFNELLDNCAEIAFDGEVPEASGIGIRQLPELRVNVA